MRPVTLRLWSDGGKVPVTWAGRERRFSCDDTGAMKVPVGRGAGRPRLEGLYVRVSGTTGQESSLDELRATAAGTLARVFRDRASGLREDRPGLEKVLRPQAQGGREELLEDFSSLVTTLAGRLYGMRSAAARRRLLAESGRWPPGAVR